MQMHVHLGLDTRVGKTLSSILSMKALVGRKTLILDFDNYGPKLYRLLELVNRRGDNRRIGPYNVFQIPETNIFVATHPIEVALNDFYQVIADVFTEINTYVQQEHDSAFRFEHIIVESVYGKIKQGQGA
jgi:hypothetical protein